MNPYHIEGPALLSISGGRTSGFMLRQIIDAHGGQLPVDVIPVFCNTGREHEATLVFLKEMGERWTPITWLEYRYTPSPPESEELTAGKHGFVVVDYCSASRNGEPFADAIRHRKFLPNPVTRFCTTELKIRTGNRYAKSLGWKEWDRAVGLRYDEPRRVAKIYGEAGDSPVCPIHASKHQLVDVLAFWKDQPFDLMLPGGDNTFGNCDLCFLKGKAKIEKIMRTNPRAADWWIEQERSGNARFRYDRPSYAEMRVALTVQGQMFDDAVEDDTLPCMCTD